MSLWSTVTRFGGFASLPENWQIWEQGVSPLSTHWSVILAIIAYFAAVFGGQEYMADKKPYKLRELFIVHNLLLSITSAVVLALMMEEVWPYWSQTGFHKSICAQSAFTPRLETLYIVNYMMKYWELADTLFLVAKKKPIIFLHIFHHPATAVLCYVQLNGRTPVSWVPIVANLTVHTVMYWYYYTTAANPGYQPWYKRSITSLQIGQFCLDLVVVYYASWRGKTFIKRWSGPGKTFAAPDCSGADMSALLGCMLLTSYLFLFVAFYKRTYNKAAKAKQQRRLCKVEEKVALRDLASDKMVDMGVGS
jgi:fatty acid elongase 3